MEMPCNLSRIAQAEDSVLVVIQAILS